MKQLSICFAIVFTLLLSGCEKNSKIVIIKAPSSPTPIAIAAQDLKRDIHSVIDADITIVSATEAIPEASLYYWVGRFEKLAETDLLQAQKAQALQQILPGERGGLIQQVKLKDAPLILLTGADIQGTQYSVYDYSEAVLGVDKLAYWTGSKPQTVEFKQLWSFQNSVVAPPVVPYLVYFENDVDELANLKAPHLEYDWESFTNLIDTLVRLRYNGIEMFDMLGRVEFYTRPSYLEMHPNYQFREAYLNKMLDYIHDKGMLIQIDMIMGRKLGTLSNEAASCWRVHKQEWIDMWTHYMTNTPIKKADIIAMRPRHPVWDWEYKSTCDENKTQVFNQAFAALGKVVDENLPEATKVVTCYHDGMEMFNGDFNPPKDFIIAWANNGWAKFDYLPESTKGYKFGTYMHAGFWLNHDVHTPYPEVIDETMTMMYNDFDATSYMMVNGQTFRPFLINLEAYSESARLGTAFNGEQFYLDWAARYFDQENASDVVSIMKTLNAAHEGKVGYVEILWHIKKMIAYLSDQDLQPPGKPSVPVNFNGVTGFFDMTEPRLEILRATVPTMNKVNAKLSGAKAMFYHDYVMLPVYLYKDLLEFNQYLIELSKLKGKYEKTANKALLSQAKAITAQAKVQLAQIYKRRMEGDKNPKWATWYDPSKRRPNNGFPDENTVSVIAHAIENSW